ncbi:excalibur calcium-binding domain-containing protein [Nocardioides houyundeii]|uniref:excalibur calcium-binding domain-containing protein n=1 Tax=Nocardioides houyundeii TaxID=2045452 RepID=UPI001F075E5B|nr:excalibur calcium-binding domain-containing protein [Nocardioides houyundeii]
MKLRGVVAGVVALVALGQCLAAPETETGPGAGPESGATASSTPTPSASPTPSPSPTASPTASATASPTQSPTASSTGIPQGSAAAALALLPVKGRAPMTGYERDRFGPSWLDADRNGCDTRNDVLAEHLVEVVLEANGCTVTAGRYAEPYTGRQVDFVRGPGTLLDIDHVVAMGNSWATGAFAWDIKKRAAFANDPLNLLPADASANRSKGDGDAATWLPAYKPFRCEYVARQVAVKAKYGLWVTAPEREAISRVLDSCPGQGVVPDVWAAPTAVDHDISEPAAPASPAPASPKPASPKPASPKPVGPKAPAPVWFQNCDAARAAGAAPVLVGDPGYGRHLDRDGDGSGCE